MHRFLTIFSILVSYYSFFFFEYVIFWPLCSPNNLHTILAAVSDLSYLILIKKNQAKLVLFFFFCTNSLHICFDQILIKMHGSNIASVVALHKFAKFQHPNAYLQWLIFVVFVRVCVCVCGSWVSILYILF